MVQGAVVYLCCQKEKEPYETAAGREKEAYGEKVQRPPAVCPIHSWQRNITLCPGMQCKLEPGI
jgi:hypothetical protein